MIGPAAGRAPAWIRRAALREGRVVELGGLAGAPFSQAEEGFQEVARRFCCGSAGAGIAGAIADRVFRRGCGTGAMTP
jgi:hypothetical protein